MNYLISELSKKNSGLEFFCLFNYSHYHSNSNFINESLDNRRLKKGVA